MSTVMSKTNPGSFMNKKIAIGVGSLLLASAAAVGAYITYGTPLPSSEKAPETTAQMPANPSPSDSGKFIPPSFVPMEPLIVNLASPDQDRYLQIQLVFEVGNTQTEDAMKKLVPTLRSRSLMILSSKNVRFLESNNAKQRLSDELIDMAKVTFQEAGGGYDQYVKNVHFTSFVIQ